MEPDTDGPCVLVPQMFLASHGYLKNNRDPSEKYGDDTTAAMVAWQIVQGISCDGGCGPESRKCMLEKGFPFDQYLKAIAEASMRPTRFVQPDGSVIVWPAGSNTAVQVDDYELTPAKPTEETAVCFDAEGGGRVYPH